MRLGVLASPSGWHFQDLARAAATTGHRLEALDFRRLQAAVSTGRPPSSLASKLDALLVRVMPAGSLEQVVFRMDLLYQLEACGLRVVNPAKTVEACVDKFLSMSRWALAGLPVPETRVSQTSADAMLHFFELGEDVVVKPLFGSLGRGLNRLQDPDSARRWFETCERQQQVIYQQAFIRHAGWDLRLLVLGQQVWGMKRVRAGHWITNIHQGGQGQRHVVTEVERGLALAACRTLGAEIAGVDLVYGPDDSQPLLLELNAAPGWEAISSVLQVDIAAEMLGFLATRGAGG